VLFDLPHVVEGAGTHPRAAGRARARDHPRRRLFRGRAAR
jgi:hypothetical protein